MSVVKAHSFVRQHRKKLISLFLGAAGVSIAAPLANKYSNDGLKRFCRSAYTGIYISLDYWWTLNVKLRNFGEESLYYQGLLASCHQRAADRIYCAALKNGGVYIKMGQGLCSLNQLLPKQYVTTLKKLEDQALPFITDDVNVLFNQEFNCSPLDLFQEFDIKPVAAASLALVFKAKTKNGINVAVKTQYLNLRDRFEGDIWCLKILMRIVEKIHPDFGFSWILDELKDNLANELDFEHEAKNSEQCKADLECFDFVSVPKIHWNLTSKRIMTSDWYDACKCNDKKAILQMGLDPVDIATKMFQAFGEQIFCTGFIHADPHPGNVLVAKNLSSPNKAQLIILDHGLYERLSKSEMKSLCHLWKAIVEKDEKKMKHYSIELGIPEKDHRIFCEMVVMRPIKMNLLFNISTAMTATDKRYVYNQAAKHFDRIMDCLKRMPKPMILVFRNLNTVRSINQTLGNPSDRFTILAKSAVRGIYKDFRNKGRINFFRAKISVFKFVLLLRVEKLKIWFLTASMKIMQLFSGEGQFGSVIKSLES